MTRAPQKRTMQTRAKLLDAAADLISVNGYTALRVEEVVLKAGVAKGTFFAHFADKDQLMNQLIGAEMDRILDHIEAGPVPKDADSIAEAILPLAEFMTCERYVLDIILRYSVAPEIEQIEPIARNFGRQIEILMNWCSTSDTSFRKDIDAGLLAEGVHAFLLQAMALKFCALHCELGLRERLRQYLRAWLAPVAP